MSLQLFQICRQMAQIVCKITKNNFLCNLDFQPNNKKKKWENCFENVVSEIH